MNPIIPVTAAMALFALCCGNANADPESRNTVIRNAPAQKTAQVLQPAKAEQPQRKQVVAELPQDQNGKSQQTETQKKPEG